MNKNNGLEFLEFLEFILLFVAISVRLPFFSPIAFRSVLDHLMLLSRFSVPLS